MYQLINKSTGESESVTEQEAVARYGTDKVNAMMFDLDPDMSLSDAGDGTARGVGDFADGDCDYFY